MIEILYILHIILYYYNKYYNNEFTIVKNICKKRIKQICNFNFSNIVSKKFVL